MTKLIRVADCRPTFWRRVLRILKTIIWYPDSPRDATTPKASS